jgi:hypothetical protein
LDELVYPSILVNPTFDYVLKMVKERNLAYVLFSFSNLGEFYYDDFSDFLNVQRFKHSTLLEFIWASFPTFIIILILIPSLFLLYSMDEEFDPEFTLKVIGHQ